MKSSVIKFGISPLPRLEGLAFSQNIELGQHLTAARGLTAALDEKNPKLFLDDFYGSG